MSKVRIFLIWDLFNADDLPVVVFARGDAVSLQMFRFLRKVFRYRVIQGIYSVYTFRGIF